MHMKALAPAAVFRHAGRWDRRLQVAELRVEQTMMTLGLAGSPAGGVVQNCGTFTKILHVGNAARGGVPRRLAG